MSRNGAPSEQRNTRCNFGFWEKLVEKIFNYVNLL